MAYATLPCRGDPAAPQSYAVHLPMEYCGRDLLCRDSPRNGDSSFLRELIPDRIAVFHVDDVTDLRKPVNQGSGKMFVLEKGVPIAKAEIRGDKRGLRLVPFVHQGKEETDLYRFDFHVP